MYTCLSSAVAGDQWNRARYYQRRKQLLQVANVSDAAAEVARAMAQVRGRDQEAAADVASAMADVASTAAVAAAGNEGVLSLEHVRVDVAS